MQKLTTCLWFDDQAEEAASFYQKVFPNSQRGAIVRYGKQAAEISGRPEGSVLTVGLRLENIEIEALNGGPQFQFNPTFSYMVKCQTADELKEKWKELSQGGKLRLPLQAYPWAELYGWTSDRFGVEWQLILDPSEPRICPSLLFVDQLFGKGREALELYTSLFPNSEVKAVSEDSNTKTVMHADFTLNGQSFCLMEGPGTHGHVFNEAGSIMVHCDTQDEIDFFWEKLTTGGREQPCGWLKDRFGVSWQIVPSGIESVLADPKRAERAMKEMFTMTKLDLERLFNA